MRSSLADQRQEPRERGTRRQEERREGRGRAARIAAVEEHASDGETEQGDAEKDGGARVDEQHLHTDRRKRKAEHPTRMPQEEEEERERDGHENMAVERSRLAEQRERPSVPGASATAETVAVSTAAPSHAERNSARPASYTTANATGAIALGSCSITCVGPTPPTFATSARNACQSGKAYPG